MKIIIAVLGAVLSIASMSPATAAKRTPVLVELFTSEGCSDCPPANALLTELSRAQSIPGAYVVALGEHVDYFNRPWVDPFSSAQFTDRQDAYVRTLHLSEPYTPEMVVDGRVEFVGSDENPARSAIAKAALLRHANVDVSTSSGDRVTVRVHVSGLPAGGRPYLFVALTEDGLMSHVLRGENRGRTLAHSGVVRKLVKVGPAGEGDYSETLATAPPRHRERCHVVAFVQDIDTGAVEGTGMVNLR